MLSFWRVGSEERAEKEITPWFQVEGIVWSEDAGGWRIDYHTTARDRNKILEIMIQHYRALDFEGRQLEVVQREQHGEPCVIVLPDAQLETRIAEGRETREKLTLALREAWDGSLGISEISPGTEPSGVFAFVAGSEKARPALRKLFIDEVGGEITPGEFLAVSTPDDYTLRVELATPNPSFLEKTSFYTFLPVPRHVIEPLEKQNLGREWTRPHNIQSNGAYKMVDWRFRHRATFERNPHYWDAENVRTSRVRLAMVETAQTSLAIYRTGRLDRTGGTDELPGEFIGHLRGYKDFNNVGMLGTYFLWFNIQADGINDLNLRKALSLAVNRKQIVDKVVRGGQDPRAWFVAPIEGYVQPERDLYNPTEAKRLFALSAYSKRSNPTASHLHLQQLREPQEDRRGDPTTVDGHLGGRGANREHGMEQLPGSSQTV